MNIRFFTFAFFFILLSCESKSALEKPKILSEQKLNNSYKIKSIAEKLAPSVMYKSVDLGKNWTSFANGIPENSTLSGIKQFRNKIYVTTDYNGIYVSSNGQDEWVPIPIENYSSLDINCIEVEFDNILIGTLNQGVLISDNGGLSWKRPEVNIADPIRAFIKFENVVLAGTDAGIYKSEDMGETWSHVFGKIQILGFTLLNNKIYAATQNGAILSDGDLHEWRTIYDGDALHDISNDGKNIYAMTIGQNLLKTQNDGLLWENVQNGITRPPNFYTNEIKYIGEDIFSAQWIGIYHSKDEGKNWTKLKGLPDSTAFSTLEITEYGIISGISIRE